MEDHLFFFLGDAVGKGTAGAMIASQLQVLFRALLPLEQPLNRLVERVNRVFCESAVTDYFATVVCGLASSSGGLMLVNAGHVPPLLLRSGQAMPIFASGPPLGLFPTSGYDVKEIRLVGGETLLLCTDGVTEARDLFDNEYGLERLTSLVAARSHLRTDELVKAWVDDVAVFSCGVPAFDDRTVMALKYR
jgi:sigma-B regulation protein RsbU (phosphoserine phosphatase)